MLDAFRDIHLTWDKSTKRFHEMIRAAASDEKGRKLVVQVIDSGQVQNLTGVMLNLYWKHAGNGTKGLDHFELVDAEKGIFQLYFTTGMLSNTGKLDAHLHLIDPTGAVTSEPFVVQVFPGVDTKAIQSSDSFSALTDALNRVVEIELNEGARQETFTQNEASRANTFTQSQSQRTQEFGQSESGRDTTFKASEKTRSDTFSANETIRETNENTRKDNEAARVLAENTRNTKETARNMSEGQRVTAETNRQNKESERVTAETERATAEGTRVTNETARSAAEGTRATNEAARKNNETARETAETNRESRFGTLVTELESIDVADIRRKTNDTVFTVDPTGNVDFKNGLTKNGHQVLFFTESETW